MVTPVIAGSRQAKRRAAEAIADFTSTDISENIAANMKSKRPRINLTKASLAQGKKKKATSSKKSKYNDDDGEDDDDNDDDDDDDDDSTDGTVIEYSWPEPPVRSRALYQHYNRMRVSLTSLRRRRILNIRDGGCIRIVNANGKQMFCRVNRFVSRVLNAGSNRKSEGDVKVEGYWLLNRKDLEKHFGKTVTPECQEYIDKLTPNEMVLSDTLCTLDITGIECTTRIHYIQPNQPVPSDLPANTYFCRFMLEIDKSRRTLDWSIIDPRVQDAPSSDDVVEEFMEDNSQDGMEEMLSQSSEDTGNDSDTSSSVEEVSRIAIREGGSATLRTEIRVGPKFQVNVPTFSSIPIVQSRTPLLIYKANSISDDELFLFLNNVADIHNKYLDQNAMTLDEPYSPLSQSEAEKVMNEAPTGDRLTGSSMSTASMLAGKRCRLMKECDPDVILEILAFAKYDTKCALETIERDLNRITAGWTRPERDIFDDAFRRNNGSLRKVSKAITPTKNVKDVIDYFFRFKVSDQFRKFQDKKRAMAVRIAECIETKKYCESLTLSSNGGSASAAVPAEDLETFEKSSHWSEKSASSMGTGRDDRIHTAKRLFLDVKDRLGTKKMAEVASVIRQLQACYEPDGRFFLFKLLEGQPELQRRFIAFLPKHF